MKVRLTRPKALMLAWLVTAFFPDGRTPGAEPGKPDRPDGCTRPLAFRGSAQQLHLAFARYPIQTRVGFCTGQMGHGQAKKIE